MNSKEIIDKWFQCWNSGQYRKVPITDQFEHTSPFGTIEGMFAASHNFRDFKLPWRGLCEMIKLFNSHYKCVMNMEFFFVFALL